ncbi:MAG: hypothetical protein J6D30_04590 [Clostridia bacterium]|nr:hypothetical protein [Clostridia bacterium]MBP3422557.1 hypothetical protein [Clostridia bacterium]
MKNCKRFLMIVISVLTFVLIGVTGGCKQPTTHPLTDCKNWINASKQSVKTVQMDLEMQDSGVKVYAYEREITFEEDGSASVKIVESKLNSAFALESKETTERVAQADRNTLLTLSLEESKLKTNTYADGKLTVTVAAENVDDVLGWELTQPATDVEMVFVFANQQLTSVSCSFKTATGKNVSCSFVYGY